MPSVTIPLVGPHNTRHQTFLKSGSLEVNIDQRFRGCVFDVTDNPVTGAGSFSIQKRPGLLSIATRATGTTYPFTFCSSTGNIITCQETSASTFKFYIGNSTSSYTEVGSSVGTGAVFCTEAYIGSKQYYFITAKEPTSGTTSAFYLVEDSYSSTTFTADTSNGSPTLSSVSSVAGVYVGQPISGSGIPSNTYISSVGTTTITMNKNATATASTVTITKTPLATFYSLLGNITNFPSGVRGGFVYLDGYVFVMTENGRIYQSALNNPASWSASDYLTVPLQGNSARGLALVGGKIAAFTTRTINFYSNTGNPSGSVLSENKELFQNIGCEGSSLFALEWAYYSTNGTRIFFIGSRLGKRGIYTFDGYSPVRISTNSIDKQLSNIDDTFVIYSYVNSGKTYIYVSSKNAPYLNFLGCLENKTWAEGSFESNGYLAIAGGNFGATVNNIYEGPFATRSIGTSGRILQLSDRFYTDNGTAFTLSCQTSKTDFGSEKLKTIKNVALLGADIQPEQKYLLLDGSSGGYASTPDSSAASVTGDIDIRVSAALDDWTPSGSAVLVAKEQTASTVSYRFGVFDTTGLLFLLLSQNGSTTSIVYSDSAPSFSNGSVGWVRATWRASDGRVQFFSSTSGITWTQVGADKTISLASIHDNNSVVEVGSVRGGTAQLTDGKIYYAEVLNGIDGTTSVRLDPQTSATVGGSSFTSASGEVWTINGTASISNSGSTSSTATLEYSDDDYATWTTAGTFDLTTSNPRIYRCGSFKGGRAWRLTHSANTAFRAQALKFEYKEGAH